MATHKTGGRSKVKGARMAGYAIALLFSAVGLYLLRPGMAATTGGTGGEHANLTFQTYVGSKYTSQYHLYADGLDWNKPVGLLVYADGSGEYGLKNPDSTYLLAGQDGLIAVAKKHNMVLLTPFAPNTNCSDGDGSCWYLGDPPGYTAWAEELVKHVESQYPIDTDRVAFGGYSSGAQLASEYWVPSGAAQRTMTDGVIVAISYGGSPKMTEVTYDATFKSRVHMAWNTGDQDPSYTTTSEYGVKAGYKAFTDAGFDTELVTVPGLAHARDGQFGAVMDGQIAKYVPDGGAVQPPPSPAPTPTPTPTPPSPQPTPTPPAPGTGKRGDLDGNGAVNLTDLSILLSHWGPVTQTPAVGDLDADGAVTIKDLSILLSGWGK